MNIINYRSEFLVYVIEEDNQTRNTITDTLGGAKFQVEAFSSVEKALEKVMLSPPHLVVGSIPPSTVDKIRNISSEIEIVALVNSGQKSEGVEALRRGAFFYLEKPIENLAEIVNVADRTIENIYLRIENEQLLEQVKSGSAEVGIQPLLKKINLLEDTEKIIQGVTDDLSWANGGQPVIFLKLLPAYQSLGVTASSQIPLQDINSLGINLGRHDPRTVPVKLKSPNSFVELKEFMAEVFKCSDYFAIPFAAEGAPVGVFVVFGPITTEITKTLSTTSMVAELAYTNALLTKKLKDQSLRDHLTGLFNRRCLIEKIEEEMARSRRTHFPLSLIDIEIDNFRHYNDTNGFGMGDIILKSIAQILLKTSRKIDIVSRIGSEEFAILCPDTNAVGAAVKAEKIRLIIEGTKFPQGEKQPLGKITVSVGVSEYPTIVNNADLLMRAAADALFQVKQGIRNKVCLAEAPTGFVKDFEPIVLERRPPQTI